MEESNKLRVALGLEPIKTETTTSVTDSLTGDLIKPFALESETPSAFLNAVPSMLKSKIDNQLQ